MSGSYNLIPSYIDPLPARPDAIPGPDGVSHGYAPRPPIRHPAQFQNGMPQGQAGTVLASAQRALQSGQLDRFRVSRDEYRNFARDYRQAHKANPSNAAIMLMARLMRSQNRLDMFSSPGAMGPSEQWAVPAEGELPL